MSTPGPQGREMVKKDKYNIFSTSVKDPLRICDAKDSILLMVNFSTCMKETCVQITVVNPKQS